MSKQSLAERVICLARRLSIGGFELGDSIQKAKGVSRMEIYEDVFHCWQMLDGVVPEARVALRRAAEFIRSHGSRPAA